MSAKQRVLKYFKESAVGSGIWTCVCGKQLKRREGAGWTNLTNHLNNQHQEWKLISGQPSIDDAVGFSSTKADTIFSWLEWICIGMKPFSFISDHLTRKYTSLEPLCVNTLKKYMEIVVRHVEMKIAKALPERFAIIFDGWSENSTHFVALFASYPDSTSLLGFTTVLLAFSPMGTETEFTAAQHKEFVEWVLVNIFHKSLDNVVAIIGDNCDTNKAFSNLFAKPFVGCASHRYNLAINNLLDKWKESLDKVNALMGKLKNLKLAGELRRYTELRPITRNATRWSSTASMVKRYFKIKPHLTNLETHPDLIDVILSPRENNHLNELHDYLEDLDSITVALQRESIDLGDVRVLFDEISDRHPETRTHILADSNIVHSEHFENALVKILNNNENHLSADESNAVKHLKMVLELDPSGSKIAPQEKSDFASTLIKKRKSNVTSYIDCRFIVPTSNLVERFFSLAGQCFNEHRQRLLPLNLEMQLFLKVNKKFWDCKTVCDAINAERHTTDTT